MTSGDVFHKIRFLVIDKVGNAAYGFSESCISFYFTTDDPDNTDFLCVHLLHPPSLHQTDQENDAAEGQLDGHSRPNTWQSVGCCQQGC